MEITKEQLIELGFKENYNARMSHRWFDLSLKENGYVTVNLNPNLQISFWDSTSMEYAHTAWGATTIEDIRTLIRLFTLK